MFSDNIIIGLDIGTDSIKMVEVLHRKNQAPELLTYGIANHNINLEGYWDHTKLRQLSVIIEDIMKTGHFSGVKTIMSVQSKDVYVTTMDFDLDWNKRRIQEEIEKQAPYFLPYPPDEMRISWSLIEDDQRISQKLQKQRVIIKALPDFVIDNSKNLLEHVNLDGLILENQTDSQIRASLYKDRGNTVLVDVGARQTTFSIIVDGNLRSSSYIPSGTESISKSIAQSLGIDLLTAEYFKRDLRLVNLFQLPQEVTDTLNSLKSELTTFVELNRRVAQDPEKIIFTGGGIYTAGFLEFFRSFEVPIYFANPLRNVYVSEEYKPYILPIANQLCTAIGLAIRQDE